MYQFEWEDYLSLPEYVELEKFVMGEKLKDEKFIENFKEEVKKRRKHREELKEDYVEWIKGPKPAAQLDLDLFDLIKLEKDETKVRLFQKIFYLKKIKFQKKFAYKNYLFDQLGIHSRLLVPGLMGLILRENVEWIDLFTVILLKQHNFSNYLYCQKRKQ